MAVATPADVEQFTRLLQGETESLRHLDHAQDRDRFGRVQPVPTR